MKLAWLTDLHLNFLAPEQRLRFLGTLAASGADALAVGGDVAEAGSLCDILRELDTAFEGAIYFVLGNHDYYHGGIRQVRAAVAQLHHDHPNLYWLPYGDPVPLSPSVVLAGHSGWGDARLGDYEGSRVMLNDYVLVEELSGLDHRARRQRLANLGEEAAAYARQALPGLLSRGLEVIFLTHVPPFEAACWHEGAISAADWLPHFTCGALGRALSDLMAAHPEARMTVLCGHTHGQGKAQIAPNLRVLTGGATYKQPEIQCVFQIDPDGVDEPQLAPCTKTQPR